MVNREFKDKLWAARYKKKPRPTANPVQIKLNAMVQSVVTEVTSGNQRQAIQAIMDLASHLKTIGLGRDSFLALMENIEIMAKQAGLPDGEVRKWLRNKEYYSERSKIIHL